MDRSASTRNCVLSLIATLCLLAGVQAAFAPAVLASTFSVTTLNDVGSGSLRQAIVEANSSVGADTITFAVVGTITLASPLPTVTSAGGPLLLQGPGASRLTISGNDAVRVLEVSSGAQMSLDGIRVANGHVPGNGGNHDTGGGVYNDGTLSVTNTIFSGNTVEAGGGAIYSGGTLTLTDTTFSNNTASSLHGGVGAGIWNRLGTLNIISSTFSSNAASGSGGAVFNNGGVTHVATSTFSGNSATGGGAIASGGNGLLSVAGSSFANNAATGYIGIGGGIFNNSAIVRITDSTFSGNSAAGADGFGGGIYSEGFTPVLDVVGSTFSGNLASGSDGARGGAIMEGSHNGDGVFTVTNSTFVGNSALGGTAQVSGGAIESGGGIVTSSTFWGNAISTGPNSHGGGVSGRSVSSPITLRSTIVGNSLGGGDCFNSIVDGGYNLSSDSSCGFSPASNSQPGVDPLLGVLANNGGLTQTMLPGGGSLAIEQIPTGINGCGTTIASDQREISRPQGTHCDIGAVEVETVFYTFTGFFAPVDNGIVNVARAGSSIPLKFRVTDGSGAPVIGLNRPTVMVTSSGAPCDGGDPTDAIEQYAGGSGLKDLGNGYYRFNWKTPKGYQGQCRTVTLHLGDGNQEHTAQFRFR